MVSPRAELAVVMGAPSDLASVDQTRWSRFRFFGDGSVVAAVVTEPLVAFSVSSFGSQLLRFKLALTPAFKFLAF